jgi:hypothetical protein
LFRFTDAKAWALVGHGEVQILQSNDTGKMYLRMRGHGQTLVNQFGTSLSLGQVWRHACGDVLFACLF